MAIESPSTSPQTEHTFSRCPQCNVRKKDNTRNIVVCIDGTSNRFGQNVSAPYLCIVFFPTHEYGQNTNVVKLLAKIDLETETPRPKQYTYYSSGIGTRPKPLHVSDRIVKAISDKFDMAIAWFALVTIICFSTK